MLSRTISEKLSTILIFDFHLLKFKVYSLAPGRRTQHGVLVRLVRGRQKIDIQAKMVLSFQYAESYLKYYWPRALLSNQIR